MSLNVHSKNKKQNLREIFALSCSLEHYSKQPRSENEQMSNNRWMIKKMWHTQLTLEQHGFELMGPLRLFFFTKCLYCFWSENGSVWMHRADKYALTYAILHQCLHSQAFMNFGIRKVGVFKPISPRYQGTA